MDKVSIDNIINENSRKEAINILAKLLNLPREQAALYIAIHLGETDGDVIVIDDKKQASK